MAIVEAYVGQPLTADFWNTSHPLGEVARTYRGTTYGPTSGTTELAVLRLDGFAALADRSYMISVTGIRIDLSVASDHFKAQIRLNTAGTATTSSTPIITRTEVETPNTTSPDTAPSIFGFRRPTVNETWSILYSIVRTGGTGVGTGQADDDNDVQFVIHDLGYAVEDTGTVL